jgi:hypothetical protein
MLAALAEGRAANNVQQTIATGTGRAPVACYDGLTYNYRQFGLLLKIIQDLPGSSLRMCLPTRNA